MSLALPFHTVSQSGRQRVLFVQVTEPGAYPPLISATQIMADAGWEVVVLASPNAESTLRMPPHPSITIHQTPKRPSYIVRKLDFLRYMSSAARLALRWRPHVVYASDPLGALPGLLAARLAGARLVYHEHDNPSSQRELNPVLRIGRRKAMQRAHCIVFPNAERAACAYRELAFPEDRLRIVWNVPRRSEIPNIVRTPNERIVVYYHGSIVPDRLPRTVPEALKVFGNSCVLRIAGYETVSGRGYVAALQNEFGRYPEGGLIEYVGSITRDKLLLSAATADIGLALMPMDSNDLNMRCMTGASNKAFDYMAAGLPLIVSDLPDWRALFVTCGHALPADPRNPDSIAKALKTLIDNPKLRREMGKRNRDRIAAEWNYETQFAPVLEMLR